MSKTLIKVENLSKKYYLREEDPYVTLRESIKGYVEGFTKAINGKRTSKNKDYFWAIKDISFEVRQGEVVGVIGRNGAGKSTLLKVLSRITYPTEGRAILRGRVGSLLEVGTGFHMELTGRENIFLNGVILGMKKREIRKQFDEIVEFSGIEKFIDTPVKHYSSGMQTRLAFSVAAFLDPEILLIDEVLSVGDAEFQKKSLGKMEEIAKEEGRTILFVSHSMAAIENLCDRAILLEDGRIKSIGRTNSVIEDYMSTIASRAKVDLEKRKDRKGTGEYQFTYFCLRDLKGKKIPSVKSGQDFYISLGVARKKDTDLRNFDIGFAISDKYGRRLIVHWTNFTNQSFRNLSEREEIKCRIEDLPLAKGSYNISLRMVSSGKAIDDPGIVGELTVESGDFFGTGSPGLPDHSPILIHGDWLVSKKS